MTQLSRPPCRITFIRAPCLPCHLCPPLCLQTFIRHSLPLAFIRHPPLMSSRTSSTDASLPRELDGPVKKRWRKTASSYKTTKDPNCHQNGNCNCQCIWRLGMSYF